MNVGVQQRTKDNFHRHNFPFWKNSSFLFTLRHWEYFEEDLKCGGKETCEMRLSSR